MPDRLEFDDDRCPVCGETRRHDVVGTPYRSCSSCGHHDAGRRVESGAVINHALGDQPPATSVLEREQVRTLVRAGWERQRVIDLGCGHGGFLHAVDVLRGLPPGSYGVEVSPESVEAAARWFGLEVRTGLSADGLPTAVTSWHSAEHIPLAVLRDALASVDHADSLIVISVPNAASWQWRLFGPRWTYYDVTSHRSQFTPRSLDLLMTQAGWTSAARPRMVLYELFGAVQSLVNVIRPHNRLYETLKRGRGGARRIDIVGDAVVAAFMAVPAVLLALGGLLVPDRASCVNAVYRRSSP